MGRLVLILAMLMLAAVPARAERLVTALSTQNVEISSSFDGEVLSLFGNIEPDAGADRSTVVGPYQIIVVITGPLADRVARLKTNVWGIWLNTDQVLFNKFPSYFRVVSSARLTDITDAVTLDTQAILPDSQTRISGTAGWWNSMVFGRQLIRLMTERQFLGVNESGVNFLSDTAFSARVTLPHDIANGPFLAQTYLFKDGQLLAKQTDGFSVRKVGFERFVGTAARQYPLLYGLVCVLLALFTGWLGGVVFKR